LTRLKCDAKIHKKGDIGEIICNLFRQHLATHFFSAFYKQFFSRSSRIREEREKNARRTEDEIAMNEPLSQHHPFMQQRRAAEDCYVHDVNTVIAFPQTLN
jgi:hypothetical protein